MLPALSDQVGREPLHDRFGHKPVALRCESVGIP
jgi:hypothetical protein